MKHIRIYENTLTVNSVRNMIIEYRELLHKLEPYVHEIYQELANDPHYEPEYGDVPYEVEDMSPLELTSIGYDDKGVQMVLHYYDNNGEIESSFYIYLTNEEFDEILIKINSGKYNL